MSLTHSLKIVTNGLVLCLDAGSKKSYAGTGNVWRDLSGNGNDGTLTNGPTFSTANRGCIVFDGINDFVPSSLPLPISNSFTISVWVKNNTLLSNTVQRYVSIISEIGVIRYDGFLSQGQLHFYIKTSGTFKQIRVNNALQTNVWYYLVGTWDGTTQSLYKNGSQIFSQNPGGTLDNGALNYYLSAPDEPLNGNMGQVCIYNRAITVEEVSQNFNATRGRYGI
jgi:hypothetical protein